MKCPNCDAAIPDDSIFCSSCGQKLETSNTSALSANMTSCPNCNAHNSNTANYCTNCRAPLTETAILETKERYDLQAQQAQVKMQAMALKAQQEQLQLQKDQFASMAKCPRCGSTSLSGNKKGFGIGKAVIGAALVGPLGLVAGNVGAKKVQVTCLKCGKKFKA
ncbi:MAG: zinc ribbon domain-containing protein [Hungatella sp.]|jgi:hypothetical protein|nr:zinc ribbon domain-containing protein [Hungatella sp.]